MQGLLFIFYSKLWSAVGKQLPITFCGFVSGCEALALSGRAACTKPLLAAAAVNLVVT